VAQKHFLKFMYEYPAMYFMTTIGNIYTTSRSTHSSPTILLSLSVQWFTLIKTLKNTGTQIKRLMISLILKKKGIGHEVSNCRQNSYSVLELLLYIQAKIHSTFYETLYVCCS
jgi:hypothetical protein